MKSRPEYDEVRETAKTFARQSCVLGEGLDLDDARKLRTAIHKSKDFFACVRSENLPATVKGPYAVFGGYCLSEEEIAKAKGKS